LATIRAHVSPVDLVRISKKFSMDDTKVTKVVNTLLEKNLIKGKV
jgi:predicted transcriptional regulator